MKPNIVVIMADQLRADLRKGEGYQLDTMPFVDSLASDGVDFSRAYTSMPTCVPARISMFTGRFPQATHVRTNFNAKDAYFDTDLLGILKQNHYVTGLSGKNHTYFEKDNFDFWYELSHMGGTQEDRSEEEKAFDEYLHHVNIMGDTEPTPFPLECQGPYRAVSKAQEWINSQLNNKEQPFFLWLSFAEPHNPTQVPEPYFSMFSPEYLPPTASDKNAIKDKGYSYKWLRGMFEEIIPNFDEKMPRTRSSYLGMMRLIDDQIKRFVEFLKEKDVLNNTLIVFLADHGDFVGEYGLVRKGPGLSDSLCRIPMIFYGAGVVGTKERLDAHVSIVDIMPTICEAIGCEIPKGVQGRSLWPILTNDKYPKKEFESIYCEHGFGGFSYTEDDKLDPVIEGAINSKHTSLDCLNSWTQAGTMRMIRKGDWKLLYDMEGRGELYNLADDPVEVNNLFYNESFNEIKAKLIEDLLRWSLRAQDPLPYPGRRYVVKTDKRNYYADIRRE